MPPKKSNNSKTKTESKTDQDSGSKDKSGKGSAVKLRHILCEKQSKILEALEKLKAGKSFNDVATEYSEDKAKQGGSLGWFTKIALRGHAFEQTAFSLAVSSSSKPIYSDIIKTKFGYHVIMVEEKK